jgi:hypothetical protein
MTKLFSFSLKDPAKLGLILSIFFFAGIITSSFILFMLPHDLVFKGHVGNIDGAWKVLVPLFVIICITFIFGISAVTVALKSKKNTIVYLEKKKNGKSSIDGKDQTTTEAENLLTGFRSSLSTHKGVQALEEGLNILCRQLDAGQGALYTVQQNGEKRMLELRAGFALNKSENSKVQFEFGEGLIGQAALTGNNLYLDEVPDGYITVLSGLGSASAKYLFLQVIKGGDETKGIIEIATFSPLKENVRKQIEEISKILAEKIS